MFVMICPSIEILTTKIGLHFTVLKNLLVRATIKMGLFSKSQKGVLITVVNVMY